MTNLTWHVQRLRKMPLQEIPYRCLQSLRKAQDKYLLSRPAGVSGGEVEVRLPGVAFDADAIGPDFAAQLAACATEIRQHRFRVFGLPVVSGPAINWHLDPKTGRQWPLGFWGDIDYRDGTRIGGIKFAWELNRLYHLPILALAYRHVGDPACRQELFEQLASWLAGNPYPRGINWISGIELAIRLVNLVYSLLCIGLDGLTDRERRMVLDFVSLHGRHLYRYPSRHSSRANHAVAEGLGLYVAGSPFPALPGALSQGKGTLERMLRESRPDYHCTCFRAGGFYAQPSGAIIRTMKRVGLFLDSSVVKGYRRCRPWSVDYSQVNIPKPCWWTTAEHLTAEGDPGANILELPVSSQQQPYWKNFHPTKLRATLRRRRRQAACSGAAGTARNLTSVPTFRTVLGSLFRPNCSTFDYCKMTGKDMWRRIDKLRDTGGPVVLIGHAKDFFDAGHLQRFLAAASQDAALRFSTFSEYLQSCLTACSTTPEACIHPGVPPR
jgi:hypothetical protein